MIFKKAAVAAIAATYLSFSGAAAFAQVGGGDVPTDAKKQGEKEIPGSTGTTKGEANSGSMKKDGGMEKSGDMKKSGDKM